MGWGMSKEKSKIITDAFAKMEEDQNYTLDLGGKFIGDDGLKKMKDNRLCRNIRQLKLCTFLFI